MQTLERYLAQYAACHRDRRNIATHFAGIPMIVFAVVLALTMVSVRVGSIEVTAAAAGSILASLFYLALDLVLGAVLAAVLFAMCAGASEMAARLATGESLAWAAGLFVAGWALQFLGHRLEGVKPAFLDDLKQLLVGPLFVAAEAAFLLGARPALRRSIEERVGPTVARRPPASPPRP